jgi:CRP-like cAMP-binding protein
MPYDKLISRLQVTAGLSQSDRNVLANMPSTIKTFEDGECLSREGDIATQCTVLLSGFLIRHKIAGTRMQILAFHVPGDLPDLQTLHLPLMDHDVSSSGPSTVAFVKHAALNDMLANSRSLTHVLWRETLVDAAIYREWVANLGSRDALARVAHVICELAARLDVVGLVQQNAFHIPFTQKDMADACGVSAVHINRTLQDLRGRGLISWQGKTITLLKRQELEDTADFLEDYLHQDDPKLTARDTAISASGENA